MCAMQGSGLRDLSLDEVREFGRSLLVGAGMVEHEAQTIADLLVETSLRGVDSHGIVRFPMYARRCRAGGIVSPAPLTWVRDDGATSLLDAGSGAGHVAAMAATERVIGRASSHGIAAVGVRMSNHIGALASYVDRIAEAGHVGIVTTNASPQIAPTGGAEGLLGNNPLAIAVPSPDGPIVMDMANSVAARGRIRLHKAAGTPVPLGWARNVDGEPTTDPDEAMAGLLEPIAGHKGYALVFMMDVLAGIMTGSRSGPEVTELTPYDQPTGAGHFFLAIRLENFTERREYDDRITTLADRIRGSRRARGVDEVFLPGDLERRSAAERQARGLPAGRAMLLDFRETADELGVPCPEWLVEAIG
jgi:LDH2 family malate/lactate/ureidoglycolate dehydrogenase